MCWFGAIGNAAAGDNGVGIGGVCGSISGDSGSGAGDAGLRDGGGGGGISLL